VPPAAWAQAWTDGELVEEAYACPGPDASYRVNVHGRLSSAGALTLSVGTDDPVRVRVRCLGYYAEPESQVAARDASPLRFTLHPACSIHITPLDDRTGDPVEPKTFRIVREGHGLLEKGAFPERGMPGRYARGGLRPGTYVVEIVTPPYVDWRSPPIVLTEPAESKHVVANLVVNRDLGTLALSVPQPEAQPTAQESVHVAIRHAEGDGTWQMHGWYRWPPGNAPTGTPAMLGGEIGHLPSGRYDVILWVGRKRLVGKAQSVVVKPGETTEVAIYVAPGLSIRASKQAEEDRSLRTVIVRSPDLGRLPYMFLLHGGTRIEVDEHLRNATELGPYPVDELSIVEKRPGEDPVVRTVRR
jgi:hypothetical protein